jgi:hypothetical protein
MIFCAMPSRLVSTKRRLPHEWHGYNPGLAPEHSQFRRAPMMPSKRTPKSPSSRFVLERAVEILAGGAVATAFVRSYARMNPAANIRANAFYFGEVGEPPRVVLWGPWAYIHAPGVRLPKGVQRIAEQERKDRHLGALHARVRLKDPKGLPMLAALVDELRSATHRL